MNLTQAQKDILAKRPYYSDLRLSIYQPKVLLGCKVASGTYNIGSTLINYDTVSTGSFGSVVPGVTCYIGTAENKADLGRLRVRQIDGSSIKFSGNGQTWQIGQFLTVVNYHEIWPVYTSAVIAANNEDYIDYMDTDVIYSNQNTLMGSLICMGPNRAAYLDNGPVQLYYTASGTWNTNGDSLAYSWAFEGGSPSTYASGTPGYVSYSTPGHYVTKLQVISSSGATGTSYRHVSIYPSKDDFTYKNWGISDISGSRDAGGYYAKVWIRGQLPEVIDGSLVVIQGDHWAGDTKLTFGGNAENSQGIFFVGYIIDGSLEYDYQDSKLTFDMLSPAGIMKLKETLSYSATSVNATPIRWGQIPNLTWKKAVFFYLRWLTTVLETCDVQIIGTDINSQYFDIDQGTIYDSLQSYVQTKVVGEAVTDLQGKLWIEQSVGAINNATGTIVEGLTLTNHEWRDVILVDEQNSQKLSQIEIGAAAFAGASSGSSTPLLSLAPGYYPNYFGKRDSSYQGLVINNQADLNILSGNLFAWKTAKYGNVEARLAGTYRNFDIAPQEIIPITTRPADSNQRVAWTKKPFVIRDMGWEYDPQKKLILPSMSLHEVTQGVPGVTEQIPVPMDYNYPPIPPGGGFFDFPWPILPGGIPPTDIPPVITPPPTDDEYLCRNDLNAAPNGPYPLGSMVGQLDVNVTHVYFPVLGWQGAWMRAGASANPTMFLFNGTFEKFDVNTNNWIPNTDKNAIHVYAIDPYGNRIATGIMDDVTSQNSRSGKFLPPAGTNISQIEVEIDFAGSPTCSSYSISRDSGTIYTTLTPGTPLVTGINTPTLFYRETGIQLGTPSNPFTGSRPAFQIDTIWNTNIAQTRFRLAAHYHVSTANPALGFDYQYFARRTVAGAAISDNGVISFDRSDLALDIGSLTSLGIHYQAEMANGNHPYTMDCDFLLQALGMARCTLSSGYLWNLCAAYFG